MKKILLVLALFFLVSSSKAQYTMPINRVHDSWHFIAGYGSGMMISMLGKDPRQRIMLSAFSGAALGIAKEGYDLYCGGKPSLSDVAITTAGSVLGGMVVNWAFKKTGRKQKQQVFKL